MTASDVLLLVVRANLVLAGAVALILTLRPFMTRRYGARVAYALWGLAPLAVLSSLAPARRVVVEAGSMASRIAETYAAGLPAPALVPQEVALAAPLFDPVPWLVAAWAAGAVACLALLAWRQHNFGRALGKLRREAGVYRAEAVGVGPAVIGALRPRIVVPADFEARFAPEEREVVLAHEETHFRRGDPLANGVLALGQCLFWLNPLVHVAAHYVRLDQELACDAAVIARFPGARKRYAEAMLKTQLAPMAAPLACYWPARSAHPMKHRIAMLKATLPDTPRRLAGLALVGGLSLGVGVVAWAAQPARIDTVVVTRTGPPPASLEAARARAETAQAEVGRIVADRAQRQADGQRRVAERQRDALEIQRARLDAERNVADRAQRSADARAAQAEQTMWAVEQARLREEVSRQAAEQARIAVEAATREAEVSVRVSAAATAAIASAVSVAVADELQRRDAGR